MTRLDILSDPICPWCYIAKHQLDTALREAGGKPFAITWHPFQLNPDMPPEGMDRRAYLEAKFGGQEGTLKVYGEIARHAEAVGVEIDFAAMRRTPNTLDAHRLIHWAGIEHDQNAVVDALFAAYFRQGRDIGDPEVLVEIAEEAGMDGEMVRRLQASDADRDAIRARDSEARDMGVSAVPTFIVANQHVVPGAQPPELWARVIGELRGQASP